MILLVHLLVPTGTCAVSDPTFLVLRAEQSSWYLGLCTLRDLFIFSKSFGILEFLGTLPRRISHWSRMETPTNDEDVPVIHTKARLGHLYPHRMTQKLTEIREISDHEIHRNRASVS